VHIVTALKNIATQEDIVSDLDIVELVVFEPLNLVAFSTLIMVLKLMAVLLSYTTIH
jgi:hypothetical protein